MARDEKIALTEAMVFGATALGVHIVREIAVASLAKQSTMSLSRFLGVLDQYAASVKKTETYKTVIVDPPEDDPETTDVIQL